MRRRKGEGESRARRLRTGSRIGREVRWGRSPVTRSVFPSSDAGLGKMPPPAVLGPLALRTAEDTCSGEATGGSKDAGTSAVTITAPVTVPLSVSDGPPEPGATTKETESKATPFVLGEGIPPVPARVVARIRKGEYIDMADLLRDNLEAERRSTVQGTFPLARLGQSKPLRREIPDVLSWAQCFGVYIGVVVETQPERTKQLLAYQATILREARRCGGNGWRGYDSMFRQLAATDEKTDWSRLNPSLFATTFLAQQGTGGKICQLCMGADHMQDECALAPLQAKAPKGPLPDARDSRPGGHSNTTLVPRDPRNRRRSGQACYSWNEGRCHFPYCRYRHVCLRCRGDHRVPSCPMHPTGGWAPPPPPGQA